MIASIFLGWWKKPAQDPRDMQPNDQPGRHRCKDHAELCEEVDIRTGKTFAWEACAVCGRELTRKIEVRQ